MWSSVAYNLSKVVGWGRGKSTNSTSTYRTAINFSHLDGSTRFPKLEECAHFHYGFVAFKQLQLSLCEDDNDKRRHTEHDGKKNGYIIEVTSDWRKWTIHRMYADFCVLDHQLHECVYVRQFSQLPELLQDEENRKSHKELVELLAQYLHRFSNLATCDINCGPILNWLEIDNLGNRLLTADKSDINTPAVAVAYVIKRYSSRADDEISLEVGEVVSVINKLPPNVTVWWRGKKDFEVGFFPSECVEIIGDTVPPFVASRILHPSTKKMFSLQRRKEKVFGVDMAEYLLKSGHDVPPILKSCTEIIESHGIVNNIYRQSGMKSNIHKLRLECDEDSIPDLKADCYRLDIHSISSLLQKYFRELPNPLLTYQLYDKFIDVVKDEENMLMKVHDVIQQLPLPHYRTTEFLMRHLARMEEHELETDMKLKNLAFVWAPILLRSEVEVSDIAAAVKVTDNQMAVIECLISHCSIIFNSKMSLYSVPDLQISHKKPDEKSMGILTSKQLLSLEQARKRNYFVNPLVLDPNQKYIDLPICVDYDLPEYREKTTRKAGLIERWRKFFSRSHEISVLNHGFTSADIQHPLALNMNNNNCSLEKHPILFKIYLWIVSSFSKCN